MRRSAPRNGRFRLSACAVAVLLVLALPSGRAAAQEDGPRVPEALSRSLVEGPDTLTLGNPNGKDVVVEFFDYRCPYCRRFQAVLRPFLEEDGQARVVLKEWPIFGGVSVYAARVALAARWQGKFRAVHEGLFAHVGPLDDAAVRQVAAAAGVDLPRLERDMTTRAAELDRILDKVQAEAEALHLKGTPGLVIDGQAIAGAISLDDLKDLLASAR